MRDVSVCYYLSSTSRAMFCEAVVYCISYLVFSDFFLVFFLNACLCVCVLELECYGLMSEIKLHLIN